MARKAFVSTAIGAAFAAAISISSPANALEPKQCGTRAEILTALKNEGQVEIIGGNRAALGSPRNIFTSNADGSLGYDIGAGVGPEAGTLCVGAKYTDIRLNAEPDGPRPAWANSGNASPKSDAYLDELEKRKGDKVLMGATALVRGADGQERRGVFIMVTRGTSVVETDTSSGSAFMRTSGGLSTMMVMRNIEPTANFYALANRRVQTASVTFP
ncbi:MAG: hypothetical protein E2598_06090 [Sphingobium sp.]|nr:hypothetical protein [Sphingobium sp.]